MEFLSELHPKFVHFPIAFFILYFILEASGVVLKKEYLNKSAWLVLLLGIVGALLSVISGNQSFELLKSISKTTQANIYSAIAEHELYATISLWYFSALFFFRTYLMIKKKLNSKNYIILILLGLAGSVIIYLTGHFGGQLVYEFGVGTNMFGK